MDPWTDIIIRDDPPGLTDAGLSWALAPRGSPVTRKKSLRCVRLWIANRCEDEADVPLTAETVARAGRIDNPLRSTRGLRAWWSRAEAVVPDNTTSAAATTTAIRRTMAR